MNQWAFVMAAYGLVIFATVGLVIASLLSMRGAEKAAEAVKRRP